MKTFAVAALVGCLFASGCASVPDQADVRAELVRTDQAWSAAASEGKDVERVVSFWADDATIVPDGGAVIAGKEAIRAYVAGAFAIPGFRIGWTTEQASVSRDGTMGYTTGTSTITAPGADGQLVTSSARGVAIWRRDAGGEWKCVYDAWNGGP